MNIFTDLRIAWRSLRAKPAFTAIAVGSLALGIGANTAIFSVIESTLLRSLPYRAAQPTPRHARSSAMLRRSLRLPRRTARLSASNQNSFRPCRLYRAERNSDWQWQPATFPGHGYHPATSSKYSARILYMAVSFLRHRQAFNGSSRRYRRDRCGVLNSQPIPTSWAITSPSMGKASV